MGFRFEFLSIGDQNWWYFEAIAVVSNMIHGIRKKAAGAAGWVV